MNHRGVIALSLVVAGVAAGIIGALITAIIHGLEHLASWPASIAFAAIGGAVWWLLRNRKASSLASLFDATAQLLVVGAGASLGREQAPRQLAAEVAHHLPVPQAERERLAAAAAGAGLAAVYNIPVAGVLFALEVLPIQRSVRLAAYAVVCCGLATVTAWPVVGREAFYLVDPAHFSTTTLALLVPVILLGLGIGWVFDRLAQANIRHRVQGRLLVLSVPAAVAVVLLVATRLPEVPGNGQLLLDLAFHESLDWRSAAVLLVAKLGLTCLCLGAGAAGGVLTPSLAIGGAAGALVAALTPADPTALVIAGAAAALAVTQRAPLFATVMAVELTHASWWVAAALLSVAIPASWLLARRRNGPAHPLPPAP